jgi:regulator of protease activity HflC (stomatin/prohibitin superfamily)
MKMKRVFKNLAILALGVVVLASCTKVPAGNVGIKFYLLGKEKGVDYDVLTPGRYYIGINENLFLFPTQNQTKIWTSDSREGSPNDDDFNFQSKAGLKLSASVSIEYHVKPENVPTIFETYKTGLDEVTNRVLRNSLRDAFNMASSTRSAEEMYGEGKVAFMAAVDSIAKIEADQRGITIDDIFLVGNIVVPESITEALDAKIAATQKAQQRENELRQTEAEAKKVIAEAEGRATAIITVAEAQAKANRIVAQSLTKTLIDYNKIEKWDGKVPMVSGGAGTLIDLRNN